MSSRHTNLDFSGHFVKPARFRRAEGGPAEGGLAEEMGDVHDVVDESRHPSWAELCVEFGDLQEHKIRGD